MIDPSKSFIFREYPCSISSQLRSFYSDQTGCCHQVGGKRRFAVVEDIVEFLFDAAVAGWDGL